MGLSYVIHGCARKSGHHPLYEVWQSMKKRCYNPNAISYKWYGARGISVCDEWRCNFLPFYEWSLANGYAKGLHIDRIDNDGNYSPENCRWVTPKENMSNRRPRNGEYSTTYGTIIEINGIKRHYKEWSEITGISAATILGRYRRGKREHEVIAPVSPRTK